LLQKSDQALYAAKRQGRNRVVVYQESRAALGAGITPPPPAALEIGVRPVRRAGLGLIDLERAYDEIVLGWTRALELRDSETVDHTQRVALLAVRLADYLGMRGQELTQIRRGALLHDIGKIGIPDGILLKPGKLTAEEWEVMRMHPEYAREMLEPISFLKTCIDIPYCHHEKWDGSGYPRHLAGEAIPLSARLFSVIDVWDALNSDRCYRPAWRESEARAYILDQAGKQFDPLVVTAFLHILDDDSPGDRNSEPGETCELAVGCSGDLDPQGSGRTGGMIPSTMTCRKC
jgi:putative nucleotidyltransferase with HDIG domain